MIAVSGRAPLAGVYLDEHRCARRLIRVDPPEGADDALWPLLGHLAGALSPDRVPLLAGLETASPTPDDLQALCAAFGTTSGAPMLHLAGHTPEAKASLAPDHDARDAMRADLLRTWQELNAGPENIDLIALGSPHLSAAAMARLATLLDGRRAAVPLVVTTSRGERERARAAGTLARLEATGARVVVDLCWCSITEPILPPEARTVMTNSGKYAHYGPGLAGKGFRFGSLATCAEAAVTGRAPAGPPAWLAA
jgi:predicted aconitase